MLSVLPVTDNSELSEIYKSANIQLTENAGAVVAKNGNEVLGLCLFTLKNNITINYLAPADDLMLADGILHSALHVAECNGVFTACYSNTAPINVLKKLDFILDEAEKTLKIEKLHQGCHGC
ncbi:MAG: hypothetical protein IJP26_01365 [Clostridia bacterium]|nr:hypothetical protein [Clostridia bacterium]